jgi:hypothetical protein
MQDPRGAIMAMVNALRTPQGAQMAGDVVPFPAPPVEAVPTGPTNRSSDYAWGNRVDPKVAPIGRDVLQNWMIRSGARARGYLPPVPPPPVGNNAGGTTHMSLPPFM